MADELDSLENSQDIRAVLDAYYVKSGAMLVLLTTPGKLNFPTKEEEERNNKEEDFIMWAKEDHLFQLVDELRLVCWA
jgi:hypothetical protein